MNNTPKKFLRLEEVKHVTGLGRTTIYALMKIDDFPPSIKLSERAVGWLVTEVDAWVAQRTRSRLGSSTANKHTQMTMLARPPLNDAAGVPERREPVGVRRVVKNEGGILVTRPHRNT